MFQNVSVALSGEIEIGMIGQVENGVFIGDGRVIYFQRSGIEGVSHCSRERAGKALIAVFADISQLQPIVNRFSGPNNFVETARAAVERVVPVILWD